MTGASIMKELMEIINPPLQIIAFTLKFFQSALVCSQKSYFYEMQELPVFSVIYNCSKRIS